MSLSWSISVSTDPVNERKDENDEEKARAHISQVCNGDRLVACDHYGFAWAIAR